jgi:GMC oxidoreductase
MNQIGIAAHHVLDKNFCMHMSIPIAGFAHQVGSCKLGTDPATSVLDVHCKADELDNLYVVDASFLPEHRRSESGSDRHGKHDPGSRAPAAADGTLTHHM